MVAATASVRSSATGALWLGVYLTIVLAPVAVLLLVPVPVGGGFWWDVSMGLGFAGLTMMAVQFVLTARFRRATAPFGIDVIYAFHRYLAYALLAVLTLHPLILVVQDPEVWSAVLTPWSAPIELAAGTISLAILVLLVAVSVLRKQLRIPYEAWRFTHLMASVGAVGFAVGHMWGIGHYSGVPAVRVLWWAIGMSLLGIVLYVRVFRPLRLLRRPWRIGSVRPEPGNAWVLRVEPVGHDGLEFQPGQFAWLSIGRSPLRMAEHPFSIASAPREDGSLEFVIKELGDFTRTVGRIPSGTRAWVDAPYGAFSIDRHPDAPGYVFIAGGIGVAPMLGMLRALAERGDTRRHRFFTGHSELDRIPMQSQIDQLGSELELDVVTILETPPEGWMGEVGRLDLEILDRHLPPERASLEYFICGPVPMIRAAESYLSQLGIPRPRVHTELFDMA